MLCASSIVKNNDKEKWVYSGYGIASDGKGTWHFGDDFVRNAVICGVDNSSSSHADSRNNNFSVLRKVPTYGFNGSFGWPEKKIRTSFSKVNTKFCLSLHYNGDINYLFVNGKEIFKFKANNGNGNFPTQFFQEAYLMDLVLLNLEKYL